MSKRGLRRRYGRARHKRNIRHGYSGEMLKYNVHPLDVWGNRRDGYSVNDVYPSRGSIEIPADATDDEIIAALKKEGFVKRNLHASSIRIDGEVGYTLYVEHAPTAHPEYELRRA